MAYGSSSQISYLGAMATGALEDGNGLTEGTKELVALTKAVANGHIQLTSDIRQAGGAVDALGNRDISGFGAFTGTVPAIYTSTVGDGLGMDRISAHANLMFGTSPIQMSQTFFIANSLVASSKRVAPSLLQLRNGIEFGKLPNADSLEYPEDGVFPYYLGEGYPDLQAVVTNGVSTLVTEASQENFTLLAQDITNLGTVFNLQDIANFGNPGQVIQALNTKDAIAVTGLSQVLANIGLDPNAIFNIADSQYNVLMQQILDMITVPALLNNAQSLLVTSIDLEKLGDYTDFDKIFKNSKDIITFSSMEEFRLKLQAIELGRMENLTQLANYISRVTTVDLPTIHNVTNFVRRDYIDSLVAKFLGGTGPNENITLVDMIGSVGAVGLATPASNYRTAMNALYDAGEFTTLQAIMNEYIQGLNGAYTTVITPASAGPPPVPAVIEIADPRGIVHGSMGSFGAAKIGQIETELANIMSRRNVNSDIQTAVDSWQALFKKIFDEKDFQSRIDMNYDIRTDFSDNALNFIMGLRGTIEEDGKKSIITGMINQAIKDGDVGGEYLRAYLKELENKEVANDFDIRWRAEFDT
jgi:hypothetical protein